MLASVHLTFSHPQLRVSMETMDDAGVYVLRDDLAIVQTVDYFTPVVDDPYAFGQIAAANALSDIYAMGATPVTALNIVGFPISKLPKAWLAAILEGGADKVREAGAVLVGGHSIDDGDPKYGLAITGVAHPDEVWRNTGAQPGDALILTKPLGAGVITTGIKRGLATEDEISEVTRVMAHLNRTAAETARRFTVHACTDVTGFGLLGHALEMARGSGVSLTIEAHAVPMLAAARRMVELSAIPGGTRRNTQHVAPWTTYDDAVAETVRTLLADSITSGGLLLAVPAVEAEVLVRALRDAGEREATVIGEVGPGPVRLHVMP